MTNTGQFHAETTAIVHTQAAATARREQARKLAAVKRAQARLGR